MGRYQLAFLCLLAPLGFGQSFTITTIAGNGVQGFSGDNGPAVKAAMYPAAGLTVDNNGNVYFSDTGNARIRKIAVDGTITTVAGNGGFGYSGDGGPATSASLNNPRAVAVDAAGNLFIGDSLNYVIRKVDTTGIITTIAGNGNLGFSGDGMAASAAQISSVGGLAFDPAGNLFFADTFNRRIRKIAVDGTISTVAGTGVAGFSGDGGPALNATMYQPNSVALDTAGNIYVADSLNHAIRKISTAGIMSTLIGKGFGIFGFSGDGGPAVNGMLQDPQGAIADQAGNVYITDEDNNRIRVIAPTGIITTITGDGTKNFAGDGGPSLNAEIFLPEGIALGPNGTIYFVDSGNKRIRALIPTAKPPSVSPGGVISAGAFGASTGIAPGAWLEIYGTNLATATTTWSGSDFKGITAPTSLSGTYVTIGNSAAFVEYADPSHVNVQVPSDVPVGTQQLTVTTPAGVSAPYSLSVTATAPGLLAPPSFVLGGQGYVVALFPDGFTYVLPPGAIPGVPSRRAHPGDIITFYGVGFGPVTPAIPAGQIVQQQNALLSNVIFSFNQTTASTTYAGLAPGAVGLYQFNVIVPSVPASDSVVLTFTLGGVSGKQTLLIPVQ
jgi:uncharacterized protein (TIGR03437 family)